MIIIKFNDNIEHKYNTFEEILKLDEYNDIICIYCNDVLPALKDWVS